MNIRKPDDIPAREITDKKDYLSRRMVMRAAITVASVAATASVYRVLNGVPSAPIRQGKKLQAATAPSREERLAKGYLVEETQTPFKDVTTYNNFYEFSTSKGGVAGASAKFVSRPWTVAIEGLVRKPKTFDLDDLLKISPLEERVYRHRCVEAWSMVIPWLGFPLNKLLDAVEPLSGAKYVQFQTLLDPERMPNQNREVLPWPYVEGLRMDEAMHPLTLLTSGLYGQSLLPQNGAPLRLVIPWKYGFKGTKSIVRISLIDKQPPTTWNTANPGEYGFYSNVNPEVDHPRWSQAHERRIGEGTRPTLMFNGYADQVAQLYTGLDLKANY